MCILHEVTSELPWMLPQCSVTGLLCSVDCKWSLSIQVWREYHVACTLSSCGAGLHSLLSFFTFQTFSWRDIISIIDHTQSGCNHSCLWYYWGTASGTLLAVHGRSWSQDVDDAEWISWHLLPYNRLVVRQQAVHFHPWAANERLDCSQVVGLVPFSHSKTLAKEWIWLKQGGWATCSLMTEYLNLKMNEMKLEWFWVRLKTNWKPA